MIRRDRLVHSGYPYAVRPGTFTVRSRPRDLDGKVVHRTSVQAFWFKGRVAAPTANMGELWGSVVLNAGEPAPDLERFLGELDTRYGGDCVARWDGRGLWHQQLSVEGEREALGLLRPALEGYPAAPEGYAGWWYAR